MKRVLQTAIVLATLSLGVVPVAHAQVKDAWITAKAKIDLMTTDGLRTSDLNVDTENGVVTLHGHVPSAMQRDRAEQVTKSVKGVKSVKNLLQVVSASQEDSVESNDALIKSSVEQALKNSRDLAKSDIHVASVNKGVVLLAGNADDVFEQLHAVEAAYTVKGVHRVASEVKVKSMD
ncbi:MAG: BON domain-containing protein [Vicinamibacterales bacterium]